MAEDKICIYHSSNPATMIAEIFYSFASPEGFFDLKYYSLDALQILYKEIYKMVASYFAKEYSKLPPSKKAYITRWVNSKFKNLKIYENRDKMLKVIFDDILAGLK